MSWPYEYFQQFLTLTKNYTPANGWIELVPLIHPVLARSYPSVTIFLSKTSVIFNTVELQHSSFMVSHRQVACRTDLVLIAVESPRTRRPCLVCHVPSVLGLLSFTIWLN